MIHQLTDSDEAARAALKAGFAQWETLLAEGLRRVADNGGLIPGADPPVMAVGLLAAYQGGLLLAELSGDVEPLRRALGTVTGLALAPFAPA